MRVFEFHFNPKLKPDLIFDSFCYEPENIYEKRLGSLYMVGFLKNVLPQNVHFLDRLVKVIKEKYYRSTLIKPEKSLKESLKEANQFLEGLVKKSDVSWLGNLSFGIISLKNFELNFTKIGDLKFFLFRAGKVIDIGQKLKFQEIEPYPLKIFGNIVFGKLAQDDLIVALTKEVNEFFQNQNLLVEMAKILPFDEKRFKEIFEAKREELSKISGICLAIFLSKEVGGKKEIISPKLYPKEFSLREAFGPVINYFKKLKLLKLWKLKWPKIIIPKITIPKPKISKNQILILALTFFLVLGFFIAQIREKRKLEFYQTELKEIQEKVWQAESFLILKEVKPKTKAEANSLLKESWEEISQLSKIALTLPKNFQNQVFSLKDEISKNLFQLNNLELIEEPELIFEFEPKKFIPQKMVFFNNRLYFFSPYAQNLFKLNKNGEGELIEKNKKFNLAAVLKDSILFFSKPNQIFIFQDEKFFQFFLKEPFPGFSFDDFSSFRSNLYFLNRKSGEIAKYSYLKNFQWSEPVFWLNRKEKTPEESFPEGEQVPYGASRLPTEREAMTIDGNIWILNKNNSISQYRRGYFQKTLFLDFFPEPKNLTKIFASPHLPYLYLLEPVQKRIVILNKKGEIIKQFQSKKFDNLLDFAISEDGKTIYLLNGMRVYEISE